MKDALFSLVTYLHSIVIFAVKDVANMLIAIVINGSTMLLKIIDPERMEHAEEAVDQEESITELKILQDISLVRDEAIRCNEWNEDHEEHLSFLASLLYNQHDWDEDQISDYIRTVVATGPAMPTED